METTGRPKLILLSVLLAILTGFKAFSQTEYLLIVRFDHPEYDFPAQTYCLDVEFQSDTTNVELYGMNVRFFYSDSILEYESMGEFQGGYGPVTPDTGIAGNFSATELYPGRLQITSSAMMTDYPNGSAILHLTYKYLGGSSALTWYNNGTSCQLVNANTGLPLNDSPTALFYIPGNISKGQYTLTVDNQVIQTFTELPSLWMLIDSQL